MENRLDVVFTLKNSNWDNNEIKYSIRSIEKHLKNYRNIYIVGDLPDFLQNITYYYSYTGGIDPIKNVNHALHSICQVEALSDNFIYFNDDMFLLEDIDMTNYPYYYDNDRLLKIINKPLNDRFRWITINSLNRAGISIDDIKNIVSLEVHTPVIFNKEILSRVLRTYKYHDSTFGILFRLLYGISIQQDSSKEFKQIKDLKINKKQTLEQIKKRTKGKHVFSIGELGICEDMKLYLEELYPNKSKYEK